MTPKHTPGPWSIEPKLGRGNWLLAKSGEHIALACRTDGKSATEEDANALLIAAAPDLLAACLDMLASRKAGYDLPWGTLAAAVTKAGS